MTSAIKKPSIAVVIPIYKDDVTLLALLQNLQNIDIDAIIIADGQARPNIAADIDLKLPDSQRNKITWLAAAPKGRGAQIQAGIARARADYIWVLHADSCAAKDAPKAIRKTLARPKTSLGTFTLKFDKTNLALSLFAWISRLDSPLTTFGDQGFFFRRKDYGALGLNLTDYLLLEDVAMRRAFKGLGDVTRSPVKLVTSARRFERRGIWATQIFNAHILWRYLRGESPSVLYLDYYQTEAIERAQTHSQLAKPKRPPQLLPYKVKSDTDRSLTSSRFSNSMT